MFSALLNETFPSFHLEIKKKKAFDKTCHPIKNFITRPQQILKIFILKNKLKSEKTHTIRLKAFFNMDELYYFIYVQALCYFVFNNLRFIGISLSGDQDAFGDYFCRLRCCCERHCQTNITVQTLLAWGVVH